MRVQPAKPPGILLGLSSSSKGIEDSKGQTTKRVCNHFYIIVRLCVYILRQMFATPALGLRKQAPSTKVTWSRSLVVATGVLGTLLAEPRQEGICLVGQSIGSRSALNRDLYLSVCVVWCRCGGTKRFSEVTNIFERCGYAACARSHDARQLRHAISASLGLTPPGFYLCIRIAVSAARAQSAAPSAACI